MPRISAFYGIVVAMYFNDHEPPHFHARYAEHEGKIEIATGEQIDGDLPARVRGLVREWSAQHRSELEENWRLARALEPLNPIEPLP